MIVGCIPARYGSTRFPGKPLVDIYGKTMIQRVYNQCQKVKELEKVIVLTDDVRIYDHVLSFGGEAIMTPENINSGTDRCLAALKNLSTTPTYIVNIQGDEPYIQPQQIAQLCTLASQSNIEIGTACKAIKTKAIYNDPNRPKVVINAYHQALYFSRSPIPYGLSDNFNLAYQHIGLYLYRTDILKKICALKPSKLEQIEKLEQLRWLENGFTIKVMISEFESWSIDTPEDLKQLLSAKKGC